MLEHVCYPQKKVHLVTSHSPLRPAPENHKFNFCLYGFTYFTLFTIHKKYFGYFL